MDVKLAPMKQHAVLARLIGHTFAIPNLKRLFVTWPEVLTNPHYRSIVPLVNQALDRISAKLPLLAKRKKDDIALLTALWYPHAEKEVLQTLALFAVWLVCWDDIVDGNEGDLSADLERANTWRDTTVDTMKIALGTDVFGEPKGEEEGDADDVNLILQDFGERYRKTAPVEQCTRLFAELCSFVKGCGIEQRIRLEGQVPTYKFYMTFRLQTVGGGPLCSLVEYATQERLPPSIHDSKYRKWLWDQVCVLLALINDLLSLKKEVAAGCVVNAVATLFTSKKHVGDVGIEVEEKMEKAVEDFEHAAEGLLGIKAVKEDEELKGVVTRYIDGCRSIVTGTLEFTLTSPRYNLSQFMDKYGGLTVCL
ncbi:Fc.00g066370.m01.CDS01 [Cosmosporella sp. VM-42]